MVVTVSEIMTTKEAAKLLGMSRCSVYRWLNRGWITGITLPNGTIRVIRTSIDKVLAGR